MPDKPMRGMTISGLAASAGVGVETVRYYQRRGLMPAPGRPARGVTRFGPDDMARLRFIRRAQALGFSLDKVGALLALDAGRDCMDARAMAVDTLARVRGRLADLQAIEHVLQDLVARCEARSGRMRCPMIDAIAAAASTGRD